MTKLQTCIEELHRVLYTFNAHNGKKKKVLISCFLKHYYLKYKHKPFKNLKNHTPIYVQMVARNHPSRGQHGNKYSLSKLGHPVPAVEKEHMQTPSHQHDYEWKTQKKQVTDNDKSFTSIGSMIPWGKPGAEPTICTKYSHNIRSKVILCQRNKWTPAIKKDYQNSVSIDQAFDAFDICLEIFIYRCTPQFDLEIFCRFIICWMCRFWYNPE